MTDANLYSDDLAVRYAASSERPTRDTGDLWPLGCGGAANAFLALVGASPGGKTNTPDSVYEATGKPMRVGPEAMNFNWGDSREKKWTRFCSDMLGSAQYARGLTALLNLASQHSTNARRDLDFGEFGRSWTQSIWPVLKKARPRIVCALMDSAWEAVLPTVRAARVPFANNPYPAGLKHGPIVFRFPEAPWPAMAFQSYKHPNYMSREATAEMGKACQWFLAQRGS
ncbi:MAG: hypothetical protein ACHQ9S_25635 [Candidatus Binatia bacterium]